MNWHSAYSDTHTIESVKKDFDDICKMKNEYSEQITKLDNKISELNGEGYYGCSERVKCLEDMRSNLLYSYKGIMSNYNAIKERLERMEGIHS